MHKISPYWLEFLFQQVVLRSPLVFDFYEPTGDTEAERPLIIHLHTGTFAPIIYNGNPTGLGKILLQLKFVKNMPKEVMLSLT